MDERRNCATILSANFLKLGNKLKRVENAGRDQIHRMFYGGCD